METGSAITMKSQFILYIDESGTKDLKDTKVNEFCYAGILIDQKDIKRFDEESNFLKRQRFKGSDPEIKSNWLRISKECKKRYLTPYKISKGEMANFTDAIFEWLRKQPVRAFGSVVSKKWLLQKYGKNAFNPSPTAYEYLLQRIANCATQLGIDTDSVSIVVDDMTGKTQAGNEWKTLLLNKHEQLLKGHSPSYRKWNRETMDFSAIRQKMTFSDSRGCNAIQIADLVAYNIMRQARDSWGNFDSEPLYSYYKAILPIMHRDPKSGKINGYGAVCHPSVLELGER